jgi:hypothetical protein
MDICLKLTGHLSGASEFVVLSRLAQPGSLRHNSRCKELFIHFTDCSVQATDSPGVFF